MQDGEIVDNYCHPNGERIRELRKDRGWTQEELAEQAECSKGPIERAEKGLPIQPGNLKGIADALKVPLETIKRVENRPGTADELDVGDTDAKVELVVVVDFKCFIEDVEVELLKMRKIMVGISGLRKYSRISATAVKLTLELSCSDAEKLCRALVEVPGFRRYSRISPTSVKLTLELSGSDAEKLVRAVHEWALTHRHAVGCKRLPES
jgi:transcriptional regulator with XRE-family HTH domain